MVFFWLNFVKWCPKVGNLIFNVLLLFNFFLVKMTSYKFIYLFIYITNNYLFIIYDIIDSTTGWTVKLINTPYSDSFTVLVFQIMIISYTI